jgi:hypothetical protein
LVALRVLLWWGRVCPTETREWLLRGRQVRRGEPQCHARSRDAEGSLPEDSSTSYQGGALRVTLHQDLRPGTSPAPRISHRILTSSQAEDPSNPSLQAATARLRPASWRATWKHQEGRRADDSEGEAGGPASGPGEREGGAAIGSWEQGGVPLAGLGLAEGSGQQRRFPAGPAPG